MEELIPEFKRDDSKDYLFILRSLNEIPFSVGKKLLIDFLKGNLKNSSIEKNKLYNKRNFSQLDFLSSHEIEEKINGLISKGMIQVSSPMFNPKIKVLEITERGVDELISPTLDKNNYDYEESEITDEEFRAFNELKDFLKIYNPEQKKAIISSKKKILCVAGAGSGKTTVLTKRIEFLNKYEKIKGDRILAITFTRKAREEMQKRLEKLEVKAKVETFNSFCEKILLKNTGRIYGKRMRVLGYQDKMFAMSSALAEIGVTMNEAINVYFNESQKKNKTVRQLQNIFTNDCFSILDNLKLQKEMKDFSLNVQEKDLESAKMVHSIVDYLNEYLKVQGLRTYNDQLNDCYEFFKKYPKEIPEFKHVLVDEFQDVNEIQVALLDLLNPENLFCVGDPRQSIFGWRGSDIKYILEFPEKFPDSEIITLKKNYRSCNHIVHLMNKSIQNMKMPSLNANFKDEKHLKLCKFSNEEEEAEFIARKILTEKIDRNEIFVLARTNKQLQFISQVLRENGIANILRTEDNLEVKANKNEVTLATIHSIKGLEAELVFVIGCNNLNFPIKVSENSLMDSINVYDYDKEEEERRLFYVAISRAKNKLYLTYPGKKFTYFINKDMLSCLDELEF